MPEVATCDQAAPGGLVDEGGGRGVLECEVVRDGEQVGGGHGGVLGEAAAQVLADDLVARAEALLAFEAPLAAAAPEAGVDQHAGAG